MTDALAPDGPHRVVVVGGGFGGLRVVKGLRTAPVRVTLVDERNFHLFQPLTYQVATGTLSPSDVTYPLRGVFRADDNVHVALAKVTGFDLDGRRVLLDGSDGHEPDAVAYDTLVVAAGSSYSYFGHEDWRQDAHEVKTLESAIGVRNRVLDAFEKAELSEDAAERAAQMTFVIVGAGPTGVEIAGQIAELCRQTLRRTFRRIDPADARIVLVEAADRILGTFPESLAQRARRALINLGVDPRARCPVVDIDRDAVTLQLPDGGGTERLESHTVIWAAGVRASPLAKLLGEQSGADVDDAGRVTVAPDLTLAGHPEVLALGDMVAVADPDGGVQSLPGLAPVAIQQGTYAARVIRHRLEGKSVSPFRYRDKGNLATIGRGRAVADLGPLHLSGVPAWMMWVGVHIWYLVGHENRLVVMLRWAVSFATSGRTLGSRIISRLPG